MIAPDTGYEWYSVECRHCGKRMPMFRAEKVTYHNILRDAITETHTIYAHKGVCANELKAKASSDGFMPSAPATVR